MTSDVSGRGAPAERLARGLAKVPDLVGINAKTAEALRDIVELCRYDPLLWVENMFPWGRGDLTDERLRRWQAELLAAIRDRLQDPTTRFHPIRIARASGHGIGKSAAMAMLAHWALSCHPGARIVVTANTEVQLRTKTSPEFAKWFRKSLNAFMFDIETLRIQVTSTLLPGLWRCDFIPWSEHNPEAFAGLHNKGRLIAVLMDEGSGIHDRIWEVVEGALTDRDTIILWVVFGNPTRNTGRFRECFRRYRKLWDAAHIDARDVEGTNAQLHREWAEAYGEDSDFFRVRVRGQFPAASSRQFISLDLVDAAVTRHLRPEEYQFAPAILSCDPAWTGDDELVIGLRQGLFFDILDILPKNDNDVEVAQRLAAREAEHNAAAVFVDAGYGTGIVSAGATMGRKWHLVWFSGKPGDPGCANKRAEMWRDMREWLRAGGAIPDDADLIEDLIGPETLPRLDGKVALESKEDMRRRGLRSPNRADALALTFAQPVVNTGLLPRGRAEPAPVARTDFDVWG